MSTIKKIKDGSGSALEFISKDNIKYKLGADGKGLTVDGSVTQKQIINIPCSATMLIDARKGNIYEIELTEDITSFGFAEAGIGTYIIKFKQDDTGGRTVTFASNFKWEGGLSPTITSAAEAIDVVSCFYDGASFHSTYAQDFS